MKHPIKPGVSVRPEIWSLLTKRANELGVTRAALLDYIVNERKEPLRLKVGEVRKPAIHISAELHGRISIHAKAWGLTRKDVVEKALRNVGVFG